MDELQSRFSWCFFTAENLKMINATCFVDLYSHICDYLFFKLDMQKCVAFVDLHNLEVFS